MHGSLGGPAVTDQHQIGFARGDLRERGRQGALQVCSTPNPAVADKRQRLLDIRWVAGRG